MILGLSLAWPAHAVQFLPKSLFNAAFNVRRAPRATLMSQPPICITVVGIGGGGSNAVDRMVDSLGRDGGGCVELVALNTDAQALSASRAPRTLQIGTQCTRGLGAGGQPSVGKSAAVESLDAIQEVLDGQDMVFITAGMGGGTGTGAAPIVARCAREAGALTVGIVTKPFAFEGRKRSKQAAEALEELRPCVDILIVVANDRLIEIAPDGMALTDSFALADEVRREIQLSPCRPKCSLHPTACDVSRRYSQVLRQGIVGLTDLVLKPGLVNVDFADLRTIMESSGLALMGVGRGHGLNRAQDAANAAISSPLLELPMRGARRVVFSLTGGSTTTLQHVNAVAQCISEVWAPLQAFRPVRPSICTQREPCARCR